MNMWGTLFGGGASANKKKQDAAKNSIIKLREQVNMLEKKEAHLQKQIDDLTATAKRNVTTNKKGKPTASSSPSPLPRLVRPTQGNNPGINSILTWDSRFGSIKTEEGA